MMQPARPTPPTAPTDRRRILLVDDEERIQQFVARALRRDGYQVDVAGDGADGLRRALSTGYDLVILDLLMPQLDGGTVLRDLLRHRPNQTVLVLSCLTDTRSKVAMLRLGADDYLAKPFSLDELLARVRARLRGTARQGSERLAASGVVLDFDRQTADVGAGPVSLTKREFLLLREFGRHPGVTLSKEHLLAAVWGYTFDPGSNVVDVFVGRLRAKLGGSALETVRGEGYRLGSA